MKPVFRQDMVRHGQRCLPMAHDGQECAGLVRGLRATPRTTFPAFRCDARSCPPPSHEPVHGTLFAKLRLSLFQGCSAIVRVQASWLAMDAIQRPEPA